MKSKKAQSNKAQARMQDPKQPNTHEMLDELVLVDRGNNNLGYVTKRYLQKGIERKGYKVLGGEDKVPETVKKVREETAQKEADKKDVKKLGKTLSKSLGA